MNCFHDRVKEFTFNDGQTIKMCPDCTYFDNARSELLRTEVHIPRAKGETNWKLLLDKTGLPMSVGIHQWLSYVGDISSVMRSLTKLQTKTPIVYSPLDDHDWAQQQKAFPHSLSMPKALKHFCPDCVDTVVSKHKSVRVTRGVYLPIEHECNRVRVYDLAGKLLEVKPL